MAAKRKTHSAPEKIQENEPVQTRQPAASILTPEETVPAPRERKRGIAWWRVIIIGVAVLLIVIAALWYSGYTHSDAYKQKQVQAQQADIIKRVGALMLLPQGEQPAIFTVSDPATLIAQQPFFTGAIKGDVVLVYSASEKAIIYSPSRNIIVNVGPIQPSAQGVTQAAPAKAKVSK